MMSFELAKTFIQQYDYIRLKHCIIGQLDIKGSHKYLSKSGQFDVCAQVRKNLTHNPLVRPAGGRSHIEYSIDNFVSMPIIRQVRIVIIGPSPLCRARNPIRRNDHRWLLNRCHNSLPLAKRKSFK